MSEPWVALLESEADARTRAAPVHALHDRAHQHPHREQTRARDPLGPPRTRAQLHVVARERLELLFLRHIGFGELAVLGLELLHALRERRELAARLGRVRLRLLESRCGRRLAR